MGWRTDRDLELLPCRLAGARWRDSSKRTVRPTSDQVLEGGRSQLETVREYVSGLDVHKKSVVAAVITPQGRRVKTFSTTTRALLEGANIKAGQRRCRRARGQRAGNVGGPDRGPAGQRRACSPGPGSHEEQAAAVGGGAGGFVRAPSALDAAPPPGPDRLPRHQAEGAGRGGGRADAPFPGGAEPP